MLNQSPIESYLNSLDLNWQDMFEFLPIGILFFNDKWEIKSYNNNFTEFFGDEVSENQFEGANLLTKNSLSEYLPLKEILTLKTGKFFEKEINFLRETENVNLILKGSPIIKDGNFQGGILIVEDYNFNYVKINKYIPPLELVTTFLNLLGSCFIILDNNGKIKSVSEKHPSNYENFQNSKEKNFADLFSVESTQNFTETISDLIHTNKIKLQELSYYSDNQKILFNSVFLPLSDEEGNFNRIIVLLREKKSREEDIVSYLSNASELREFESFANAGSDAIFKINLHGNITYWADNAANLFNIEKSEVISKFIGVVFYEIDQEYFERIRSLLLIKGNWQGYLKSKNVDSDQLFQVKIISKVHENVTALYVYCNNIDKQQQNIISAKEEEKLFFKDAVIKSNQMILQINPSGTVLFANDRFCEVFLYGIDEIRGEHFVNLIEPDFKEKNKLHDFESMLSKKDFDILRLNKSNEEAVEVCFNINLSTYNDELKYFTIYLYECKVQDRLFLKTAHSLLYKFPEPIVIVQDGIIIKVNPKFCKLFGSEYETDFYKKPVKEIVDSNSESDFLNILNNYLLENDNTVISFIKKDGSIFKAQVSKICSPRGFSFCVLVLSVIEDQEDTHLEKSEIIKKYFHHIGPYYWTGDLDKGKIKIDFIDEEFLKRIGISSEKSYYNTEFWNEIIHPDDIDRFYQIIFELIDEKSTNTKEINYRIINKDGEFFWINNTIRLVVAPDSKTKTIYGSITDATDWLSEREELRSIINELDKLNSAKEKFISIISHDLKSPFTSIIGFAELILTDQKLTKEDILGFVSHIKEASLHTVDLLNSLLDLTKLQTGRIEVEPKIINASYLVHKTVEIMSGLAFQKGINLNSSVDKSFYITADDNLILQVFNNLVANSIKFTPKGGSIEIFAKEIPEKQKIEFTVKDTGVGIDSEDLEKLFVLDKKFTTLGTDGERGTGLGLSLVYEIIEKHNGKIKVKSEVGKGSEFIFSLPISAPSILIVDGVEAERVLYSKLLQSITDSIEILQAKNEEEALDIVQEKMPMLIILEHSLPNMNADEFIGELTKAELIYQPSLMILTKKYTKELHDSYKDIGINSVFTKPFDLKKFKTELDKYTGRIK